MRGYRYDSETGLYYLQSRYYNPEWGRFINGDAVAGSVGELIGHNIFAYCKNNPVNMSDSSGFRPLFDDEEIQKDYVYYREGIREQKIASYNKVKKNQAKSKFLNKVSTIGSAVTSVLGTLFIEAGNKAANMGDVVVNSQAGKALGGALISAQVISYTCILADPLNQDKMGQILLAHTLMNVASFGVGITISLGVTATVGVLPVLAPATPWISAGLSIGAGCLLSNLENKWIEKIRKE